MANLLWDNRHYFVAAAFAASAGVSVYCSYRLLKLQNYEKVRKDPDNVYETKKMLNEYLVFHYGSASEVLRWDFGPKEALDFPRRVAEECMATFQPKEGVPSRALDIGCGVGRISFELARKFEQVVGVDYSQNFVAACNQIKEDGHMNYELVDQGHLTTQLKALVPADIDRSRCIFQKGDACNLPLDIGQFGCVVAANVICRLYNPFDFLSRCESLVAPGGILVILSPYSFLEVFTPKKKWIGGYVDNDGREVIGSETLKKILDTNFVFIKEKHMPYIFHETTWEYNGGVSHALFWQRKESWE
ncbi:ubiquinone biosynthesis O-methyltransferase-like [Ptychodera flava]|uniref:ubiquinone biosynthesis O-methyltransferase-like n=1 Tax=Ptychodera flava TaxID=63121 RepID=UPI003969E226